MVQKIQDRLAPPLAMSTSLPSLVLHTANVNAIAHAQQTSKMTAIMKSTAQMLQEIQCGTAAEVSQTEYDRADFRSS